VQDLEHSVQKTDLVLWGMKALLNPMMMMFFRSLWVSPNALQASMYSLVSVVSDISRLSVFSVTRKPQS